MSNDTNYLASSKTASVRVNQAGAQTVTLIIRTASPVADLQAPAGRSRFGPVLLGLLLLPLVGARRWRRQSSRLLCWVLLVVALAGSTLLTGCGSSGGFLDSSLQNYNVTVTATTGSIVHSTTVVLNLQ